MGFKAIFLSKPHLMGFKSSPSRYGEGEDGGEDVEGGGDAGDVGEDEAAAFATLADGYTL